jgi:hypothetical protein
MIQRGQERTIQRMIQRMIQGMIQGMIQRMIQSLVWVNGVYDIVCALSILFMPHTTLGTLHLSIFTCPVEPLTRRILAFWLLTYGSIRVAHFKGKTQYLVTVSYLLEAIFFLSEYSVWHTAQGYKVAFVVSSSMAIAYFYNQPRLYKDKLVLAVHLE